MNFEEYKAKKLKNPEIKKAYDELGPEYDIIHAIIEGRFENNLTQQQLAELTGIPQANISRLENGNGNPNLATLKCLAKAFGKELHIDFK